MKLNTPKVRKYLKEGSLERMFIEELGWDRYTANLSVEIAGCTYRLEALAQKRGVQIFQCNPDSAGNAPDYNMRRKIEKQVTKSAYEHLIIFVNNENTVQIWQWVARQPGKPAAYREHTYNPQRQSGDALIQKLEAITIPLDEEEALDLTGTVYRLRDAFDRDRVTKRFYDGFKKEQGAFLELIQGITDSEDIEWYASLMLNRLMFVYFIQRKSFLDGDQHYLRNRLEAVQGRKGKGKFYTFYRYFLLALFHEGFSKRPEQRDVDKELLCLLGDIPFLNGGLFDVHALEERYPGLDIPDEAFSRLFDFFDQYEWYLDARPLRNDREINPDVLGYIFEKYINQKQMGAYYTKEDITDYISKNTIVPSLFDKVRKRCEDEFNPISGIWRLLHDEPDRYIYPSLRKGVFDESGQVLDLPKNIEDGINDIQKRTGWVNSAETEYALPTETWREHIHRRQSYFELRNKLSSGVVNSIDELITLNLDICQFAEDVIGTCENPELLKAFYETISAVTVLDPTCGSGAFLFAALNVLEPIYEACLERMKAFVDDVVKPGDNNVPQYCEDFHRILDDVNRHPNRTYFILKTITIENLYGVDIMEEAVEICKLRLFLKLVSQVDAVEYLEPLPDIDFNIRPGNTVVGFITLDDVKHYVDGTLGFGKDQVDHIIREAEDVALSYRAFHRIQTQQGKDEFDLAVHKQKLRERLGTLVNELDTYLASECGVNTDKANDYEAWRSRHQPFHWLAEFYGIISNGGFDICLGNPPYRELRLVKEYPTDGFITTSTKNLFSLVLERSFAFTRDEGRVGFIVPVSSIAAPGYRALQELIFQYPGHYSSFGDRPSRLFEGLEHSRLTIILLKCSRTTRPQYFSTKFQRWKSVERPTLFDVLRHQHVETRFVPGSLPKIGTEIEFSILNKLWRDKITLGAQIPPRGKSVVYYTRKMSNFFQVLDFVPEIFDGDGKLRSPSELKELRFASQEEAYLVVCLLNSTLFRWFVDVFSDCRNLNMRDIKAFPCNIAKALGKDPKDWVRQGKKLGVSLKRTSEMRTMKSKDDQISVQCTFPKRCKGIIDDIDAMLARYYQFTDEELDFIVNYDIKYRIGSG